jgi:hypothetical protein
LDEYLPISEIRITNGNQACDSDKEDYAEVFQGASCGSNDARYDQLDSITLAHYATANGVPSS